MEQAPAQPATSPTREEVLAGAPPPSSAPEEMARAPSPALMEEPSGQPVTPPDIPDRGKGPMAPSAMVGRSTRDEEAQASSEKEVEEIQGHPRDGRQHIYVWRQRGDHWAGHEEITEVEEADRVERAAKRLVSQVKVSALESQK